MTWWWSARRRGLAAAIQAHDEGASVLIVEKMPTIGGNTIKASAGMNAAQTLPAGKGIEDSKELFYQETLKGGHNKTIRNCCVGSWKMPGGHRMAGASRDHA